MRVDMVRAVLRIIFDHEDQRIAGIGAVRYRLDQQTDGQVVIRLLRFGRIHAGEMPSRNYRCGHG